ncbi:hypothetical protein [uncultured Streptococcus sp.]|uniref:hypothetical protein n=1 Tax=uncultured Streptococcus sp. TaxID=83427 RepID=UPI002674E945|nr:hypothetical protein [uncultured Streptococcus sp.]
MEFKIINKYLQEEGRTFVSIRSNNPYTAFERVLIGDRTNESDEVLIQAVLGQVATELNPAEGVKKLQEDLHAQSESYEAKLAEKDKKIAENKAVSDWAVLVAVTNTENPLDPTLYARGLALIEAGQAGKTYKPYEIFTVTDPSHTPKFGEGQRVLVQVNQEFTYNNETVADLEGSLSQNGKLAVWKWTEPKPTPATDPMSTAATTTTTTAQ